MEVGTTARLPKNDVSVMSVSTYVFNSKLFVVSVFFNNLVSQHAEEAQLI